MDSMMNTPRFDQASILVVGDAMLDRYWHGDTSRISAEAPIPVVDVAEVEDRPGGAANVALNVVTLGARAFLISSLGKDEPGDTLRAKLAAAGIDSHIIDSASRTTVKLRIVSQSQQLIRADFEDLQETPSSVLTDRLSDVISSVDTVLLSDYDKGLLAEPQPLIQLATGAGKPVLVDPKFKHMSSYRGSTLIKPNLKELKHAIGDWRSEQEMVDRCQQMIRELEVEAMLVTRASEGMTLIRKSEPEVHFPARTREVYDVSGAGDTVIATLAAALASGETLIDATGLANVAAGLVVGHFGITSVSGPELRQAVAQDADFDRGVMTRDQLEIAVREAKQQGRRVVFTNGCFDILHAGHVSYLEEAKAQGDLLVVATNDDDSVHRLKGEGRPINPVDHRMALLAGLQAVDWVVSYAEDTPESLLEALSPDVLVKGGDYSVDQVVGADIVRGYGGEVEVLQLVEDCSTSALVEKIRRL